MQLLCFFLQCFVDVSHLYAKGLVFDYLFLQWLRLIFEALVVKRFPQPNPWMAGLISQKKQTGVWLGMERIVHTLEINLSVTKSGLIFLRNKSLYCLGLIFFFKSSRLIKILWHEALINIFNINRPHMLTIKIGWFYDWTLLYWKAHLFYLFLYDQKIFVSGHQTQKGPVFISTVFLYLFFLVFRNTPIRDKNIYLHQPNYHHHNSHHTTSTTSL